jgi:hypothetical protein
MVPLADSCAAAGSWGKHISDRVELCDGNRDDGDWNGDKGSRQLSYLCFRLWGGDGNKDKGWGWDLSVTSDHVPDNLQLRRPASPHGMHVIYSKERRIELSRAD